MSRLFNNVDSNATFLQSFERGNRIGAGAFGEIFLVLDRESGKTVAVIKQIDLPKLNRTEQEYNKREVISLFNISLGTYIYYSNRLN